MPPKVKVNIKNTFLEFDNSNEDPFAAAGCRMLRVNSCPSICSRGVDESVFSEDLSACPRLQRSDTYSDAGRSLSLSTRVDPTVVHEEDSDSCCTSIDYYSSSRLSGADAPLTHDDITGQVGKKAPTGQAAATSGARTPLSSKAGSFTPLGCKAVVFAPSCPQMVVALGHAPFSTGQESALSMPQVATDKKQFTTLMMRSLRCGVTRDELINVMNEKGFEGAYNFIYLPIDFDTGLSRGYAFVNITSEELAHRFIDAFNGFAQLSITGSTVRPCIVTWAMTQGLDANIAWYRDSSIMDDQIPDSFKPVLFVGKKRAPFPEPTWYRQ
jgi:hypothetical protein